MSTVDLDLRGRIPLFRMKSDQFVELPPSDHFRLELLDGEVLMSSRPSPAHQRFILNLAKVLDRWIEEHDFGLLLPDTQMELDEDWMPAPDLLFLQTEHLDRVEDKKVCGPADLVVEVLSPHDERADRETKFAAYEDFGVQWYWIVDLVRRQREEYRLVGKTYRKPVIAPFDKPFQPRLFQGLVISLASLELRRP